MSKSKLAICTLLALLGVGLPPASLAQSPAAPEEKLSEKLQASITTWEETFKVTPQHEWLTRLAGEWVAEAGYYQAPGVVGRGTAVTRSLVGGRNLNLEAAVEFGGQPWQLLLVLGYSNVEGRYWMLQADTYNTLLTTLQGAPDAAGKQLSAATEYFEPIRKARHRLRVVLTPQGDERLQVEIFDSPVEAEKDTRVIDLMLTRKKS
jgi:Protein of unknown function (DUF1579)